jgi:NAD(P)-dependent dehydrogenase (short-subunit alcohol dehydrogenase family)
VERIVILGAGGGIGGALARAAAARGGEVIAVSRPATMDEAGLAAAAATAGEGLSHVIVASGVLHRDGAGPERDWRQIDADWMLETFRVNSVLPALAAKHFLPRLRRGDRAVFAALSARVGSIGDNRLGGWHSYRASKAALNQLVQTLSIELRRKNPSAVIAALHPGTVDSGLSRPFQRNLAAGQLQTADAAAERLWAVIDGLAVTDSGGFFGPDGARLPW